MASAFDRVKAIVVEQLGVDAAQVTRDLWRLSRWERARMRDIAATLDAPSHQPGS